MAARFFENDGAGDGNGMDGRDDRASMNRPSRMPQPALAQCVAAKCSSHVIADNAITHPSSRYRPIRPRQTGHPQCIHAWCPPHAQRPFPYRPDTDARTGNGASIVRTCQHTTHCLPYGHRDWSMSAIRLQALRTWLFFARGRFMETNSVPLRFLHAAECNAWGKTALQRFAFAGKIMKHLMGAEPHPY